VVTVSVGAHRNQHHGHRAAPQIGDVAVLEPRPLAGTSILVADNALARRTFGRRGSFAVFLRWTAYTLGDQALAELSSLFSRPCIGARLSIGLHTSLIFGLHSPALCRRQCVCRAAGRGALTRAGAVDAWIGICRSNRLPDRDIPVGVRFPFDGRSEARRRDKQGRREGYRKSLVHGQFPRSNMAE